MAVAAAIPSRLVKVMLCIATWNVNSVRQRINHLLAWIGENQPDILLLQETKCLNESFPVMELEELGYNLALHGQKTFNGVAILSKYPLSDIITALPDNEADPQCRYIEAVASLPSGAIRVASVYVPNGQDAESDKFTYKMGFLEKFHAHVQTLLGYEEMLVLGGDYNIAPDAIDVHHPQKLAGSICFLPAERARFKALMNLGVYDAFRLLHPLKQVFSWWDYRAQQFDRNEGMRIDHLMISPQAADVLTECEIDLTPRAAEKPSDHAPVWCKLKM